MERFIRGAAYVVRDNIDTDQIIPAQYLSGCRATSTRFA
jgi:3-isopropylmalate dehydratase small subunit